MLGFLPHFQPKTQAFPALLRQRAAAGQDLDGNPADAATAKETLDAVPNAE